MTISALDRKRENHNIDKLLTYFRLCRDIKGFNPRIETPVAAGQSGDLWSSAYGLWTLIDAIQKKLSSNSHQAVIGLSRNPIMLAEAVITFGPDDLRKVRSLLKNYPGWGKVVYHYLQVCWMVARCDAQTVIKLKDVEEGVSYNSVAALRRHVIAIQKLASARGESIFWTFDEDYEASAKSDAKRTTHVHLYGNRAFLREPSKLN